MTAVIRSCPDSCEWNIEISLNLDIPRAHVIVSQALDVAEDVVTAAIDAHNRQQQQQQLRKDSDND